MSRIEKLRINNFRSIRQADVYLNDLNVFVGKNNVGKTNLLNALLWFIKPSIGIDAVDFRDGSSELVVGCKLIDITKEQQDKISVFSDSLHDYIRNNCVYIQRRAYIEQSEKRYVHVESRIISGDGNFDLDMWDRSSDINEEDIQVILPELLYIPALFSLDKTIEKFALKSLENLADIVLKSHGVLYDAALLSNDEIQCFNNQNIVRNVEDEINKELQFFSVRSDIRIKILPPSIIEDKISSASICFEESGVCRRTEYFGQGLLRMAQMAMLRYLARDFGSYGNSVLLLMDEPELSLHPQVIEEVSCTFRKLIENDRLMFQVLLCTHSPVMVKNRVIFENVRIVKQNNGTCIIDRDDVGNNEKILRLVLDLENLSYSLFSDLVIIVEGASDKILLSEVLRECGNNEVYRRATVISSQSCKNAFAFRKLLQSIGLKVVLVQDFDALQNGDYHNFEGYDKFSELLDKFKCENYPTRTSLGAKEIEDFVRDKDRLTKTMPLIEKLKEQGIWVWPCGDVEKVFYGEGRSNNKPALAREYIENRKGKSWKCYIDENGGDSKVVFDFVNWVNYCLLEV